VQTIARLVRYSEDPYSRVVDPEALARLHSRPGTSSVPTWAYGSRSRTGVRWGGSVLAESLQLAVHSAWSCGLGGTPLSPISFRRAMVNTHRQPLGTAALGSSFCRHLADPFGSVGSLIAHHGEEMQPRRSTICYSRSSRRGRPRDSPSPIEAAARAGAGGRVCLGLRKLTTRRRAIAYSLTGARPVARSVIHRRNSAWRFSTVSSLLPVC